METSVRINSLEETIRRLKTAYFWKCQIARSLELELKTMEDDVRDFIRKYNKSQSTEEVKQEDMVLKKSQSDKDYEEAPPYILVFHGLQKDWMEEVRALF